MQGKRPLLRKNFQIIPKICENLPENPDPDLPSSPGWGGMPVFSEGCRRRLGPHFCFFGGKSQFLRKTLARLRGDVL